jgi:hypothetical protein
MGVDSVYAEDEKVRDEAQEGFARRGRPRPRDTVDRDEQVYQLLRTGGATTKSDLAVKLEQREKAVYHSLTRLRDIGKVRRAPGQRDGRQSNTWEAITS